MTRSLNKEQEGDVSGSPAKGQQVFCKYSALDFGSDLDIA